jgi:hypothetical protein
MEFGIKHYAGQVRGAGFYLIFFLMSPLKHQFGHSLTDFVISLFVPGVVQCRRFPGQES